MFAKIKSFLNQSLIYGFGNFISRGINLLLVPLLTNTISTAEYGKLGIIQTFIGLAEVFFAVGMRQAILRYSVKQDYSKKAVFSGAVFWIIVSSIICSTAFLLLPSTIKNFTGLNFNLHKYILLILIFDAFLLPVYAYLQSDQKPFYYIFLKITHVVIYFSGTVFFIIYKNEGNVSSILISNIFASALVLTLSFSIYFKNRCFHIPVKLLKKMFLFGLPYVPNIIFIIVIDLIDRIIIGRISGLEEVGLYSAAAKLAMIMFLVVFAFQTAWQPFFLSNMDKKDGKNIFARIFTYYFFVTSALFLVISLFYNEIAEFGFNGITLIGESYRGGLNVVPYILIAYIFCGIYSNFIIGIYAAEKTIYIPLITFFGALLNVAGNLLLIPKIGLTGAAISTLISYGAMAAILYPISMKLYFIKYEWIRILKILTATGMSFLLSFYLESILWKLFAIVSFIPILVVLRFFLEEEKLKVKIWCGFRKREG